MVKHKFSVGQMVDFSPSTADANAPRGKYRIERQMPSETKDLQYRVKHAEDGHERVVPESRLNASTSRFG